MTLNDIKKKLDEPWRTWTWSEVQWLYERCYDELVKQESELRPDSVRSQLAEEGK